MAAFVGTPPGAISGLKIMETKGEIPTLDTFEVWIGLAGLGLLVWLSFCGFPFVAGPTELMILVDSPLPLG
jgi:hypothetical protein